MQNMALVHTGDAQFGMTTMGPAAESLAGTNPIAPGLQMDKACAMFPMYQTPFSVTALKSSGITTIADIGYDRLFREESPGTYVHDFGGGVHYRDTLQGTDIEAAMEGVVAITPLRGTHAVAPAAELAARLQAHGAP